MSFLKLVGGTDFKPKAAKKPARKSVNEAKPQDAKGAPALMEEMARKAIGSLVVNDAGMTVRGLLNEYNTLCEQDQQVGPQEKDRLLAIRATLRGCGIHVAYACVEDDLDALAYGKIMNSKLLLKKFPSMKPHKDVVEALMF